MNQIGRKLYLLRILHNFTQTYVAEHLNISPSTYVGVERGFSNIQHNRLEQLLELYQLPLGAFFSFSVEDILNVIKGKSVVVPVDSPTIYHDVVLRLEAVNNVMFQLLQRNIGQERLDGKQLAMLRK